MRGGHPFDGSVSLVFTVALIFFSRSRLLAGSILLVECGRMFDNPRGCFTVLPGFTRFRLGLYSFLFCLKEFALKEKCSYFSVIFSCTFGVLEKPLLNLSMPFSIANESLRNNIQCSSFFDFQMLFFLPFLIDLYLRSLFFFSLPGFR